MANTGGMLDEDGPALEPGSDDGRAGDADADLLRSKRGEGAGGKTADVDGKCDVEVDGHGPFFSNLNLRCAQLLGTGLPNDDVDGSDDRVDVDDDEGVDLDDDGGLTRLDFTADVESAQDTGGLVSS